MIQFSSWKRALHTKVVWFSLLVMLTFGLVAALAPWIAPHDPFRWEVTQSNLPPMWVQDTPLEEWLSIRSAPIGTDVTYSAV